MGHDVSLRTRWLLAPLLVIASLPLGSSEAGAHGGVTVISERDENYNVTMLASETDAPGQPPSVDLTTYLIGQRLGEPDVDAKVTVTVEKEGESRTYQAQIEGGGYEVSIPEDAWGDWRSWDLSVRAVGRAGESTASASPLEDRPAPPSIWPVTIALVVMGLAGTLLVRHRHSRTPRREGPAR